ncbi:MAG: pyruvate dehydrogenase (acetyl-transferring), homodimeric type, partial [Pseudohongiellaceae bacterium]
ATVRLLSSLMKHRELGKYIVPIVPDEARTFGLDALFNISGIYAEGGQRYTPVDADTLGAYREASNGQILQEGICEVGAIASFMAAGTAYAVHSLPMIPFYFFYSIFGFQRVGDMVWSCGDMLCRGFLIGGTAGRTTLNGEGLQHQDGHSQILASTFPTMKSYDPAFGFEVAIIIRDGIRRMYQEQENIFYYLTVYNENYPMPSLQDHVPNDEANTNIETAIAKGAYLFRTLEPPKKVAEIPVNLLGSGAIMQQVLNAADRLQMLGLTVKLWSITSYNELRKDAESCERWNRLHPFEEPKTSCLQTLFGEQDGVFVAVTDYMKSLANSIAAWMPNAYTALGTDGYGLSESRPAIRDYFEISADYIMQAALVSLYKQKAISAKQLRSLLKDLNIDPDKPDPMSRRN